MFKLSLFREVLDHIVFRAIRNLAAIDEIAVGIFRVIFVSEKIPEGQIPYEDARDLTQSVFVRVYEKLDSYNPKYRFFSWIYRIAINESLNFLGQKKTMDEIPENCHSEDSNPEECVELSEMTENIHRSLKQIDPKYRALIVLKHFQNCSYQQISQIMKLPEKTVKSRLYIARQQLGQVLTERGIS